MALQHYLEFESPLQPLDEKIALLESRRQSIPEGMDTEELDKELGQLYEKLSSTIKDIHKNLSPWQKVQISRHPARPYSRDYLETLFDDFVELHGDRRFAEDPAIIGGIASLRGRSILFLGQQKGRNTKQKIFRNFGMPRPEGYRKAMRLMEMAEKFKLPILSLIDTPGAYPGMGAEERGQSLAIAENLLVMTKVRVPHICVVIGEGGSGGALAIGMGDRVFMLEHSIYSVISPESCAAILWKNAGEGPRAASELKISAQDSLRLNIVDDIIEEPAGGAHRNTKQAFSLFADKIQKTFDELLNEEMDSLIQKRYEKFRKIGQ